MSNAPDYSTEPAPDHVLRWIRAGDVQKVTDQWLRPLPPEERNAEIDKLSRESGQSIAEFRLKVDMALLKRVYGSDPSNNNGKLIVKAWWARKEGLV